jgi:hypothetical protein
MEYNMIPIDKLNAMSEEQHNKISKKLSKKFEETCEKYKFTKQVDSFVKKIQKDLDNFGVTLKIKIE